MALLIAGLLVDLAFNAAMPLAFKYLIDDAIPNRDVRCCGSILAVMVGGGLTAVAAAIGRDYLYARLGTQRDERPAPAHVRAPAAAVGRLLQGQRSATSWPASPPTWPRCKNAVISAVPEMILGVLGHRLHRPCCSLLGRSWRTDTLLGMPLLAGRPAAPRPAGRARRPRCATQEAGSPTRSRRTSAPSRSYGPSASAGIQIGAFRGQLDGFDRHSLRFNLLGYLVERTPNVAFLLLQIAVFGIGAVNGLRGELAVGALIAFNVDLAT